MIRVTLIELALVATPFLLFFLYRAIVTSRRAGSGEAINETPYQILFLSGSAVALASLVAVVLIGRGESDTDRTQVYIPPRVVDGQVVPGFVISREDAIAQGLIEARPRDQDFDPDTPNDAGDGEPDAPPEERSDAPAP
jgi:hypothetical protein